jgi:hypothetical protein
MSFSKFLRFTEPLLAIVILSVSGCAVHSNFTDRALEDKFRAHKEEFDKLVQMLREDSTLSDIRTAAAFADFGIPATTAPERLAEYRSLMSKLQLRSISRSPGSGINRVFFCLWSRDAFPTGGTNEYLIYAETPPAESRYFVDSLDKLRHQTDALAFKKVADRWYLAVDNW